MLDPSGYPLTTDPGEIERRLTTLERALALGAAARSLTSSAVGGGGVRVYGGGYVRIQDGGGLSIADDGNLDVTGDMTIAGGGSLTIVDGDLVLSAGSIDGDALADQVSTETRTASSSSFALGTSYGPAASITLTRPSWASRTVVSVQAVVRLPQIGQVYGQLTGMTSTPAVVTQALATGNDADTTACLAWGGVSTAATVTATVQARVNGTELSSPKSADLQVTAIYFR